MRMRSVRSRWSPQDLDGNGVFDTLGRQVGAPPASAPPRVLLALDGAADYDEQVVIGMLTK